MKLLLPLAAGAVVGLSFCLGAYWMRWQLSSQWTDGYYGQVETLSDAGFAPNAPFRVGIIKAVTNGVVCGVMWPKPITP